MKILGSSEKNHSVILKDTYGLPVLVVSSVVHVAISLFNFQASFVVHVAISLFNFQASFSPFPVAFSSSPHSSLSSVLQRRCCFPAKMLQLHLL